MRASTQTRYAAARPPGSPQCLFFILFAGRVDVSTEARKTCAITARIRNPARKAIRLAGAQPQPKAIEVGKPRLLTDQGFKPRANSTGLSAQLVKRLDTGILQHRAKFSVGSISQGKILPIFVAERPHQGVASATSNLTGPVAQVARFIWVFNNRAVSLTL
jgi:hypothetical protein